MVSPASDRFENLQFPTGIQLSGPTVAVSVSGVIGGILNGLADTAKGSIRLIKKLGCTPTCQKQDRPWLIDTLP
jgi:hypothetical protein